MEKDLQTPAKAHHAIRPPKFQVQSEFPIGIQDLLAVATQLWGQAAGAKQSPGSPHAGGFKLEIRTIPMKDVGQVLCAAKSGFVELRCYRKHTTWAVSRAPAAAEICAGSI